MASKPVEMLRYLVYKAYHSTLLIKSPEVIKQIKRSSVVLTLTDDEIKKMSTIFYRFKPLFLAFKANLSHKNQHVVNKIRRLAVKNHKPMTIGVFESITDPKWSLDDLITTAQKESVFKIIRAMGMFRSLIDNSSMDEYTQTYIIRNNKSFTRGFKSGSAFLSDAVKMDYESKYNTLKQELFKRLYDKYLVDGKKTVLLSDKFNLTCPISEKQFIGNVPYGTSYNMKDNNYFGVYWRGEWGTDDFDLSFTSLKGVRLGWNSSYMSETEAPELSRLP